MSRAGAHRMRRAQAPDWAVLCIEDDPVVQILLGEVVRTAGATHLPATTVREAEELLGRQGFDLILLDRRLPDGDGLLLLQAARKDHDCPVIVLSELSDARERQLGIGLGATDYLAKPFSPVELSSRVRFALVERDRARRAAANRSIRVGGLTLNPASRQVSVGQRSVFLPPAEARLLRAFLEAAGEVLSRDQLTRKTCGREWVLGDRTVDVLVARLRRRIPGTVASIVTIHGTGYLLAVE